MRVLLNSPIEISPELVKERLRTVYKIPFDQAGDRFKEDFAEFVEKSKDWIKPEVVYDIFSCQVKGNRLILNGKEVLTGSLLVRNFKETKKVGLFIVTIGKELEENRKHCPDRILPIIDAIGSAVTAVSAFYVHRQIIDPLLEIGDKQVTIRLFPGVGDFPLENQKVIFELLGSEKLIKRIIGVTLTSSYVMVPNKSISAIVGIKKRKKA